MDKTYTFVSGATVLFKEAVSLTILVHRMVYTVSICKCGTNEHAMFEKLIEIEGHIYILAKINMGLGNVSEG